MDRIIILAVGAALVAVIFYVLLAKRHDDGNVSRRFDFDGYKEGELSKRGVQDRTGWRR